MKKSISLLAGLAFVGATVCVGNWMTSSASAQPARPASKPTKLAILNLKYVIMNYAKFKNFQNENKGAAQAYETKLKEKQGNAEAWCAKGVDPKSTPAEKETAEKNLRLLQREVQDITEEARNTLGKKESEQLVIIYREIGAAVSRFAQSNDIDLVLHYNDGITEAEMNGTPNIIQKMGLRSCTPVFYNQGVDVSAPVLQMLNASYPAGAAPAAN